MIAKPRVYFKNNMWWWWCIAKVGPFYHWVKGLRLVRRGRASDVWPTGWDEPNGPQWAVLQLNKQVAEFVTIREFPYRFFVSD